MTMTMTMTMTMREHRLWCPRLAIPPGCSGVNSQFILFIHIAHIVHIAQCVHTRCTTCLRTNCTHCTHCSYTLHSTLLAPLNSCSWSWKLKQYDYYMICRQIMDYGERRCYLHLRWHLNWTVHLAGQVSSHFSMPFVAENRFRRVLQKRMGTENASFPPGETFLLTVTCVHVYCVHVYISSSAHWALLQQA